MLWVVRRRSAGYLASRYLQRLNVYARYARFDVVCAIVEDEDRGGHGGGRLGEVRGGCCS